MYGFKVIHSQGCPELAVSVKVPSGRCGDPQGPERPAVGESLHGSRSAHPGVEVPHGLWGETGGEG